MSFLSIILVVNSDDKENAKKELEKLGFKKQEVYIKSSNLKENAERELFNLKHKAEQFVVTGSWWGRGPE